MDFKDPRNRLPRELRIWLTPAIVSAIALLVAFIGMKSLSCVRSHLGQTELEETQKTK